PIAGNLQIGLELLHGNGIGSDGLWAWLDVRDINGPAVADGTPRYETTSWWWWRSSRVIHEYHLSGRAEEGLEPIVEAPSFSFLLGHLRPRVLALPFEFLSTAVALAWLLEMTNDELRARNSDRRRGDFNEQTTDDRRGTSEPLSSAVSRLGLAIGVPLPLWLFTAVVL